MWRFTKAMILIIFVMAAGLVAYAYFGPVVFPADFAPPAQEVNRPVTLDTN
jgi:hypothetical protein